MRRRLAATSLLLASLALGACSSESDTDTDADDAAGTTTTAPIIEGDGSSTATDATETLPPESVVVVTDPVAVDIVPVAASGADCLQGRWIANEARMQAFITQLLPLNVVINPGSSYDLQIDGTFFSSVNTVSVSLVIPDGPQLTAMGTGIVSGTFGVNGDVVATTIESSEGGIVTWSAVIDGAEVPLPSAPTEASFTFDVNNSNFVCDGSTLVFTEPTGLASVTFDRA
jgi:hypothetical protein